MPRSDNSGRRCSYAKCENPDGSNQFYVIESSRTSGGQDWTPLDGQTICNACYCRYKRNGTLERAMNKPLPKEERRCTYANCRKTDEGSHFYEIVKGQTAGGQDWGPLAGSVLCNACYLRFWKWGSLERYKGRKNGREAKKQPPAVGAEGERVRRATRGLSSEPSFIPEESTRGVKPGETDSEDSIAKNGVETVLGKRTKLANSGKRVSVHKKQRAIGKQNSDTALKDSAKGALDMLCEVCEQVGEKK